MDLKDRAFYPESDFRAVYDQIEAPSAQALQSLTHLVEKRQPLQETCHNQECICT